MGHVTRCYKIFSIRILSIFNLFIIILYLKYEHLNHYFQQRRTSFRSFILDINLKNLIIIFFQVVLFNINFPQYYITLESFIHKGHCIKVYWIHLIYLWPNMQVFLYNLKYITNWIPKIWPWNFNIMFWCMSSLLTWVPLHHLHISIGINYYW
jgi:hypothetical protein